MHLCAIHPDQISAVEIPTGLPLIYDSQQRKIRLLAEELPDVSESELPKQMLEKYNFGSCPQLLFKTLDEDSNVHISKRKIDYDKILIRRRK